MRFFPRIFGGPRDGAQSVRFFPGFLWRTTEILMKFIGFPPKIQKKPHNLGRIPGTPENPGKNLTIWAPSPGPPKILEKTSQSGPHPRDLRKSWKKPHNLRTISGTAGNPGKNLTICGPSPGPPEILEKNLTILRICLLVVG